MLTEQKASWDAVETNIIVKSFREFGISNGINNTKDDLLLEDSASDVEEISSDVFVGFDDENKKV